MAKQREIDAPSWFDDQDLLIAELRHGEFLPRRAPGLEGFDDLHEIGRGGQAVVYAGTQRSTKRRAAVKVLLDGAYTSQVSRRRFEREIELVASLRHPNIVGVYDSGCSADGHPFCVMEYIDGVPLDDHVSGLNLQDPRDPDFRNYLGLFVAICDAVNFAHQRGVLHRDLKPGNIRIDRDGQPHILDFGLAKTMGSASDLAARSSVSIEGQFVGSLAWASPEQAAGDPDGIDIRSDVYSLGMILYFSLTRGFPYRISGALHETLGQIRTAEPIRPSALNKRIDRELETIILRCLAKEQDRRYQTAGELAADIRRYLAGDPVVARADSTWYTLRKTVRRYRTAVAIGGVVIAAAMILSVVMTILYGRATSAEAVARQEASRATVIRTFLEDMLASADPDAKGREVTVRAVLDEAAKDLETGLVGEPVVRGSLHAIIGKTYRGLGDFPMAKDHLDAAIALFQEQFGDDDEHTLEAQGELAELLLDQSKPDQAEAVIDLLRTKVSARFPVDHSLTLRVEAVFAKLRSHQGRWAEAEALFVPLVERRLQFAGADNKETLATMNNLAAVYHAQGKYAEAEALHRRALEVQTATFGKDSPPALSTMGSLAAVLNSLGKLAEAETILHEQIEGALRVWGPEHRTTLAMQSNLVFNLRQQGKFDEALELVQGYLPIQKRVLGPEHADTIQSMNGLASVYVDKGQFEAAMTVAREAYETCLRVYGDKNVDTLTSMHNYGSAMLKAGQLEDAARLFERNLELCRELYPTDHPELAWPMNELAGVWVKQGRIDAASEMYADAVRVVRKGLPPDHYFLPWLLYNRSSALLDAGRLNDAERDLLECYRLYREKAGDAHSDTQYAIRSLAKLYRAAGNVEEAERFQALVTPPASDSATAKSP
ncbi:MAG TPA: serine/threonine-protein kinase [Phycisphaerae bacterium]|nr:serine/threonine-protein kinase [Phycisphaerae bacterium]